MCVSHSYTWQRAVVPKPPLRSLHPCEKQRSFGGVQHVAVLLSSFSFDERKVPTFGRNVHEDSMHEMAPPSGRWGWNVC